VPSGIDPYGFVGAKFGSFACARAKASSTLPYSGISDALSQGRSAL
jgi:hypothetical protein